MQAQRVCGRAIFLKERRHVRVAETAATGEGSGDFERRTQSREELLGHDANDDRREFDIACDTI